MSSEDPSRRAAGIELAYAGLGAMAVAEPAAFVIDLDDHETALLQPVGQTAGHGVPRRTSCPPSGGPRVLYHCGLSEFSGTEQGFELLPQ